MLQGLWWRLWPLHGYQAPSGGGGFRWVHGCHAKCTGWHLTCPDGTWAPLDGNPPGRKHPELEFTLYAPGTSGGQDAQDTPGRRVVFLLMYEKREIVRRCKRLDIWAYPPRLAMVKSMAQGLLQKRVRGQS